MNISLALIMSLIFGAAYADSSSLDKLRGIAEKMKSYQEKIPRENPGRMPGKPSTNDVHNRTTEEQSLPLHDSDTQQLSSRYDIVGIKTGMTLAEAREIINKKKNLRMHKEFTSVLAFESADGRQTAGTYVKGIQAVDRGTGLRENIVVAFTPDPDAEKVVAITRALSFDQSDRPSTTQYVSALTEKYGQPLLMRGTKDSPELIWFFDKYGKPVPATNRTGTLQVEGCVIGSHNGPNVPQLHERHFDLRGIDLAPRLSLYPGTDRRLDVHSLHKCGALTIVAYLNGSYPTSSGLLEKITLSMTNHYLGADSAMRAGHLLQDAEAAYAKSRLKRANTRPFDL